MKRERKEEEREEKRGEDKKRERKRRRKKKREEKGLLCALVEGYNWSKDSRKIYESEDNR